MHVPALPNHIPPRSSETEYADLSSCSNRRTNEWSEKGRFLKWPVRASCIPEEPDGGEELIDDEATSLISSNRRSTELHVNRKLQQVRGSVNTGQSELSSHIRRPDYYAICSVLLRNVSKCEIRQHLQRETGRRDTAADHGLSSSERGM